MENEKEVNNLNNVKPGAETENVVNSLAEKHAKDDIEKKQQILKEQQETKEAAKKLDADPNLKFQHPLMNCEMNLMEISHRVVEKIERAKYRIVGKSEGDIEADKAEFAQMLVNELIKWN